MRRCCKTFIGGCSNNMKHQTHRISIYRLATALLLLCITSPAMGIVLHPDGEPNLTTWTDRPDSNTVGRWPDDGSCVVIGSNYVITTKHQGSAGSVVIGGVTYLIDQTWYHPDPNVDFRVVKLYSANLTTYVGMYTNTDEDEKPIVIGGFGKRRDPCDTTNPYAWTTELNNINNSLLFGTNKIDSIDTTSYPLEVLVAHFNRLSDSTYECSVAEFDSGGGWFIKDGSEWKVAGLTRGLKVVGESWSTPGTPPTLDKNYLDAVRVSTYANSAWFASLPITTCSQPVPGDFDGDCIVDHYDFEEFISYWLADNCSAGNNYCQGSDFEPDGDVDLLDYSKFLENWMQDFSLP